MDNRKLSNGLNVVIVENPSTDVVSLQLWVSCGSVYETEEEYGLSHFIEHLVFKLSGVAEIVESLGGELNAFTTKEHTCYYITLPSMYLEKGLSTLNNLVFHPRFVQEDIDSEREIIIEEIRRYQDIPGGVVMDNYFNMHFDGHPYSHPILGNKDVIRNIGRVGIIDYYSRFYTPSSCLLVVCGNVSSKQVYEKIDKLFSKLSSTGFNKPDIDSFSPKKVVSCKVEEMDIKESVLGFGFPIPGLMDKDIPALDVLALILGQGESSRLFRSLRLEKGYVTSISSFAYTPKYGGAFAIVFSMDGTSKAFETNLKKTFKAIGIEIEKIKKVKLSTVEIDKAKTILLSEKIYERETVEGLGGKLGYLISVTGGIDFEKEYFRQLKDINCDDTVRVLNKYIVPSHVALSAVFPKGTGINGERLQELFLETFSTPEGKDVAEDQSRENKSHTSVIDSMISDSTYDFSEDFIVGDPQIIHHHSGARIIMRKMTSTPLISMKLIFPGGTIFENEDNQGISNLLARVLPFGAQDLSFMDIAQIIDSTASTFNAFSGRNSIGISMEVIKPFFPNMLELLNKVLNYPRFEKKYFNREKKIIENEIKAMQDNLAQYAGVLLLKTIYKKHPYRFEIPGTLDSLKRLSRNKVLSFYNDLISPERMVLSVVGDFDKKQVLDWVDKLILSMKPSTTQLPKIEPEPEQTEKRITRFKRESKQAHILLAYKTCSITSRDRYVLKVISSILSGQSGRLFVNLRESLGLAYAVSPIAMVGPDPGYFGIYIASETAKIDQSIREMKKEILRLVEEEVEKSELMRAKNFLLGRHVIEMQTYGEQAITMGFDELYGLGFDFLLSYPKEILAVTPLDITKVAKRYFSEARENIAIVSNC